MSKLKEIKRESYFTRVRKRWKRRDVLEINPDHSKYIFTEYIRCGLRTFFLKTTEFKSEIKTEDYQKIVVDEAICDLNNTTVHFHSYAPAVFELLRKRVGLTSTEYTDTVAPPESDTFYLEFLSNSKSGQNFFFTNNKQFMIKTITKEEVRFFLEIMPRYIDHFMQFPHSLLVKFVGLHSIKLRKLQRPVYFVVMLSIFYPGERISHRYDIKACQIGRFTKPAPDGSNVVVVLKEKNWNDRKLELGQQREWFLKQIKLDTEFLKEIGVLDYSLLVGIQPLHHDELKEGKDLPTIFTRVQKSVAKTQSVYQWPQQVSSSGSLSTSPGSSQKYRKPDDEIDSTSLPGMINDGEGPSSSSSKPSDSHTCLEVETGELEECSSKLTNGHAGRANGISKKIHSNGNAVKSSTSQKSSPSSIELRCPFAKVSEEEAIQQNRRLLPNYKNELHVLDGEERYYMGVIDFFTRYTFKKKLENAYKRILYPPLSFSTVPPDVFARRFNKYWEEHTK